MCRCPQCGSLAPLLLWRACGVPPVLVLLAFLSFCCFFLALHCSSHVVFILAACHWRTRGTGSPSSSPPGPQADSMFRAPTGGPPSKGGAAVRFRRNLRARAGLLSKVAAGVKLKHRWGRREGSPGVNSSRSTSRRPPDARRRHRPSSNGAALPLSLSLLPACLGYRGPALSLSFFRQGNGVEDCSPTPRASAPPTVAGGHGGKRLCWQGPQPSRAKYLVKRDEGGDPCQLETCRRPERRQQPYG